MKLNRIYLISNMYPSKNHPSFGIFVKNSESAFSEHGINIVGRSLIYGRLTTMIEKVFIYLRFYSDILLKGFFLKYQLVYVHYLSHTSIPVLLLMKTLKIKVVLNAHGDDILGHCYNSKILFYFVSKIIRNSWLIVTPSNFLKRKVVEIYKANDDKVVVSASAGVDTSVFYPKRKSSESQLVKLIYISRVVENKGWDVLLKALYHLKDRGIQNTYCTMIGGGNQSAHLVKMIEDLSLQDKVQYLGEKNQLELPAYLNESDLFIFPTKLEEGLGLVGLEAMACGLPVIGSNIGGLTDYIVHGQNGFLFHPGDPVHLAKRIEQYIRLELHTKKMIYENCIKTSLEYKNTTVNSNLMKEIKFKFIQSCI